MAAAFVWLHQGRAWRLPCVGVKGTGHIVLVRIKHSIVVAGMQGIFCEVIWEGMEKVTFHEGEWQHEPLRKWEVLQSKNIPYGYLLYAQERHLI